MAQQSSFAPQAASTRRSQQPSTSYFGSGGTTPSYQQFGNTGNPSGIGAGSAGLNANDGPGGFLSGMSGSAQQYPGYTSNFQYGSMGANMGVPGGFVGSSTMDPADLATQYSQNMGATGDPYGGGGANFTYGSNQPQSQTGGPGAAYIVQNGQVVQDPYAGTRDPQTILANNNYARQWNQGQGRRDAIQQMLQREQQQGAANQAGGAQSAMAGMQGGMNTQAIGQQMAAFGDTATYAPPTDFQSRPQSRYEQMAVDQSRYAGMPVSQLKNIADNDTTKTSLRAPIAEQSAILARMELANRGAGGNQVAVGNQQAADPFQPAAVDQIEPGDIMQNLMGGGGFWQGLPGQGLPFPEDGMINVGGVPYAVNTMGGGYNVVPGTRDVPGVGTNMPSAPVGGDTRGRGVPPAKIPGFETLPTGVQIELTGQGGQQAPTRPMGPIGPLPGQPASNPYPGTIPMNDVVQTRPPIQVDPNQPQGIPLPGQQTPDDPGTLGANRPFREPTLPGFTNDTPQVPQGWDPRTGLPIGQNPQQPPPHLANQQQGGNDPGIGPVPPQYQARPRDESNPLGQLSKQFFDAVNSGQFTGSFNEFLGTRGHGGPAGAMERAMAGGNMNAVGVNYRNLLDRIFNGQPSLN